MTELQRLAVLGLELEVRWYGPPRDCGPVLVLLHEGLGSAGLWRDFPDRLAGRTGRPVMAFSRRGYGASDPWPLPWPVTYMHNEGLHVLPAVLAAAGIERHILIGHSDGSSIALIYAGGTPARGLDALILEAPHVFTEAMGIASIAAAKQAYEQGDLRPRLARHHGSNVDNAFYGWADAWLHPDFLHWDLRDYLPGVTVPMLLIQGRDDEYGTLAQLDAIEAAAAAPAKRLVLDNCGHAPHRDRVEAVLDAICTFLQTLPT